MRRRRRKYFIAATAITWNKEDWDNDRGHVSVSFPTEDIDEGDVVCFLCYKGDDEYVPTDDEDTEK